MAAKALIGEAAIRIVPSLRGFKPEADRQLREMRFEPIRVKLDPGFKEADLRMAEWRKAQELNAVNVPVHVRGDFASFKRDLTQVEHIFKRSSLSNAIRLNIKVVGLDALPALAYAAGSAASGLDALGKSAFALPGLLSGVGASVGALLIGIRGLKDVVKAYGEDSKNVEQDARKQEEANNSLARSYQSYKSAVRDTIREIQDLNSENRRSSLNTADAILSVKEASDRLRQGGFKSITEFQRAQLGYLESIDHLQEVQVKAHRTAEDTAEANAKSVRGADKVVDALAQIADNTSKLNESKVTKVGEALAKLSPNAQSAVEAFHGLSGAWTNLQHSVQDNLFAGLDQEIKDLGQKALPGLEIGLSRVAIGLNKNFKSVAESLGNVKNGSFMERIFGNTDVGLQRLSHAMKPLIEGFLRLSSTSSNFLPRLGTAADKVFQRFDNFTNRIASDGSLNKWIDSGLRSLDSLGDAGIQIGSIVSSVSKAFDEASGHSGGFIKSIDDGAKKLAEFLKGDKGQTDLIEYFRKAKDFTHDLKKALGEMRPFLRDVVDTTRDWSGVLLPVVGMLLHTAAAIDKHTGALKLLIEAYLSMRTFKPVVEGLTTAWTNYNKIVTAAARSELFGGLPGIQRTADNLRKFRGELVKTQDAVAATTTSAASAYPSSPLPDRASRPATAETLQSAPELAARRAAGIGLSAVPLRDRLNAADAAFKARQIASRADALASQNSELFNAFNVMTATDIARQRGGVGPIIRRDRPYDRSREIAWGGADEPVPGIGPVQGPVRAVPTRDNVARSRSSNAEVRRRENRASYLRAQGAYLQDSYQFYDYDRAQPAGHTQAPLYGAVHGPELPPGRGGDLRAPALGAMQGPHLPPEYLRQIGTAASEVTPKIQASGEAARVTSQHITSVGGASSKASPNVASIGAAHEKATKPITVMGDAAKASSIKVDAVTKSATMATQKFPALAQVASGVVPPLNGIAGAAEAAGGKIGGAGKVSMLGRISALAAGLGPGAGLMIAIPLAMFAIDQLGEAHKKAAEDADRQKEALDRLKDSVNDVTGAAGNAAIQQLSKSNQKFSVPGLGERNASNDAGEIGSSGRELLQAQLPQNQRQRNALAIKTLAATKAKIGASNDWREFGPVWARYGVDLDTFSRAANSEQDALNTVHAAEKRMFSDDKGREFFDPGGAVKRDLILTHAAAPDITHTVINAGAQAPVTVAAAATAGDRSLREAGVLARQANTSANGSGKFKDPSAASFWTRWGTDNSKISINESGQAVIITDSKPDVPNEIGDVIQDGTQFQTTLTADATNQYIQKFADGGMVRGPGGPRDDKVLVATSAGEHVTNADAVRYYGVGTFDALNQKAIPHANVGAWFGNIPLAPTPVPPPPPTPAPIHAPSLTLPAPFGAPMPAPVAPTTGRFSPNDIPGISTAPPGTLPGAIGKEPLHLDPSAPLTGIVQNTLTNQGNWLGQLFGAPGQKGSIPVTSVAPSPPKAPEVTPSSIDAIDSGFPTGHTTPGHEADEAFGSAFPSGIGPTSGAARPGNIAGGVPKPVAPPSRLTGSGSGAPPSDIDQRIWDAIRFGQHDNRDYSPAHPWKPDGTGGVPHEWTNDPAGTPPRAPARLPHTQTPVGPGTPHIPAGNTPAYAITPGPGGRPRIAPSGPVLGGMRGVIDSLVGTPYVWGGFSPSGLDCSGLASVLANMASGRDPFSSRFDTNSELGELTARGFMPGKGPPGTMTIGWNSGHTAITLPDGTAVSSGESGGVAYGGGGANEGQFTNWMYLPVDPNALAGLPGLPGGGLGAPGVGGLPGSDPGMRMAQMWFPWLSAFTGGGGKGGKGGLSSLPQNLQPGHIAAQFGQIALQGFAGAFGIDTSYLGDIDQVGNFYLGKAGEMGLFGQGATGENGIAGEEMNDYLSGKSGVDPTVESQLQSLGLPGFTGGSGSAGSAGGVGNGPLDLGGGPTAGDAGAGGLGGPGDGTGLPGGKGAELSPAEIHARYGALITQVCTAMGVDPKKWVGPLEKQIYTESKGNPNSINFHDSNGRGGEQTVAGLFNFVPSTLAGDIVPGIGSGSINDPATQIAAAINHVRKKPGGVAPDGTPLKVGNGTGFASGGYPDGLAYLSAGEYRSDPSTTSFYGPDLFNALNAKAIPRSTVNKMANGGFIGQIPRFAPGGFPLDPPPFIPPPQPGESAGPLQLGTAPAVGAAPPAAGPPPMPGDPGGETAPLPGGGISFAPAPGTGGLPGPGATAPAPDPGSIPGVGDALSAIGGMGAAIGGGGGGGLPQPGAQSSDDGSDQRATLGASPTSNDHNLPALSQGIQGAAGAIGSIAAMAAQSAIEAGSAGASFGAGAPAGAAAGGVAAQGIQAGAQVGGQIATGAVNILSSLLVGTATGGSTSSASGVPLLPQRPPVQNGVAPIQQRVHNGDINVTNLDEYKRQQQLMDSQQAMPFIGKYNA